VRGGFYRETGGGAIPLGVIAQGFAPAGAKKKGDFRPPLSLFLAIYVDCRSVTVCFHPELFAGKLVALW